jgi:hypothetical protein
VSLCVFRAPVLLLGCQSAIQNTGPDLDNQQLLMLLIFLTEIYMVMSTILRTEKLPKEGEDKTW